MLEIDKVTFTQLSLPKDISEVINQLINRYKIKYFLPFFNVEARRCKHEFLFIPFITESGSFELEVITAKFCDFCSIKVKEMVKNLGEGLSKELKEKEN